MPENKIDNPTPLRVMCLYGNLKDDMIRYNANKTPENAAKVQETKLKRDRMIKELRSTFKIVK